MLAGKEEGNLFILMDGIKIQEIHRKANKYI